MYGIEKRVQMLLQGIGLNFVGMNPHKCAHLHVLLVVLVVLGFPFPFLLFTTVSAGPLSYM